MEIPELKMKAFSYGDGCQVMVVGGSGMPLTLLGMDLLSGLPVTRIEVPEFKKDESVKYDLAHIFTDERFNVYVVNDPTLIDKIKNGNNFAIM